MKQCVYQRLGDRSLTNVSGIGSHGPFHKGCKPTIRIIQVVELKGTCETLLRA